MIYPAAAGMERLETTLEGPLLLRPDVHGDERGFFKETYRHSTYSDLGIGEQFVQDNQSRSRRGVIRGMHFQLPPGQAKLVLCARGEILDVVVDIRRASPSYGQRESFVLSDDNHHQIYCPIGFAHGFCVTSEVADVVYKVSGYYDSAIERGFSYADPEVAIEWPDIELLPSARDSAAPALSAIAADLPFDYS